MVNHVIRRAVRDDVSTIVGFNQSMAMETEGKSLDSGTLTSGVEAVFDNPEHGFYIVCDIDGKASACLMITYEWSDWRNGLFWWIQSVYVKKEFRGSGLFKSMYNYIKTLVDKDKSIAGIRLYVDDDNILAQNVYRRVGMQKSHYKMFEYLHPE